MIIIAAVVALLKKSGHGWTSGSPGHPIELMVKYKFGILIAVIKIDRIRKCSVPSTKHHYLNCNMLGEIQGRGIVSSPMYRIWSYLT